MAAAVRNSVRECDGRLSLVGLRGVAGTNPADTENLPILAE
jgi:hypothetical protein